MNAGQQGFLGGALAGAGTGAMVGSAFAGPSLGTYIAIGAAVGFVVGGIGGAIMGEAQEDAAERERQELEQARVAAVMREFGIMQQKANMATAGANRPQRSSTPQNTSGDVSATQALNESGFIGQNIINTGSTTPSASGTF